MMNNRQKERIREAVRERYSKVAKAGGIHTGDKISGASCCAPSSKTGLKHPSCCSGANHQSDGQSVQTDAFRGYTPDDLKGAPEGANMGLGCGNPVALASLEPGETVVDLGSGGGFDCFLAAARVRPDGRVIGVDMTPEMIDKARRNARKSRMSNVEFRLGEIEHLPVADNSADIILSNCVINLSADKTQVYKDAFRVLKPGGRLAISDILTTEPLPPEVQQDLALVSACIGGAATIEDTRTMLESSGFVGIHINPIQGGPDGEVCCVGGSGAAKYLVSATIEAKKPA